MNITFIKNLYDEDGDIIDTGIYLHINDITIIKLQDLAELQDVARQLTKIYDEIYNNYFNQANHQENH